MKYRIKEVGYEGMPGATPVYYIQRRVWFWWVDHYVVNNPSEYMPSNWVSKSIASSKNLEKARRYVKELEAKNHWFGKSIMPKVERRVIIHYVEP